LGRRVIMDILGSIANGAVGGILGGIGTLARDIREAIVGKEIDPAIAANIEVKLVEMENQLLIGQMQINLEEAKSESLFVAGWRPFIGWVSGCAVCYNFIAMPLLVYLIRCWKPDAPQMPVLEISELMVLLGGMLGFGTLRSYDKKQSPNPVGKE
jgi:hypothetical protein